MRFELKYAYPPHMEDRVFVWLQAHTEAFRTAHPPRQVNNVYFDTPELDAFVENLAGISRRCKMRLRWYGDSLLPSAGTFEFKNKHAALGWKDSFAIENAPYHEGDTWRDVRRAIRKQLSPPARIAFDEIEEAVLINSYQRRYFLSRDGALRLTLDRDQVMFDQLARNRPNTTRRLNLPAVHILELKCEDTEDEAARRALANCPIRGSRFSKYTVGAELRD